MTGLCIRNQDHWPGARTDTPEPPSEPSILYAHTLQLGTVLVTSVHFVCLCRHSPGPSISCCSTSRDGPTLCQYRIPRSTISKIIPTQPKYLNKISPRTANKGGSRSWCFKYSETSHVNLASFFPRRFNGLYGGFKIWL